MLYVFCISNKNYKILVLAIYEYINFILHKVTIADLMLGVHVVLILHSKIYGIVGFKISVLMENRLLSVKSVNITSREGYDAYIKEK